MSNPALNGRGVEPESVSLFPSLDEQARLLKEAAHKAFAQQHTLVLERAARESKTDSSHVLQSTGGLYGELMKVRNEINKRRCERIVFQEPVLVRDEDPVLFLRTILLLQAKFGRHKSRMVENICSAILRKTGFKPDNEHIGFRLNTLNPCAVLYVDTERSITESFPFAIQNILANAGYSHDADLPNFDFISLVSIPRESRFDLFAEYLSRMQKKFEGKHLIVVLDVLTDLVTNFNDVKESMRLIDLLNSTINQYDVTFICVIHENPNSDKARGHIGSEALNKASTVIALDFVSNQAEQETDVVCVRYLKCRNTRKHEPFYVQYDNTVKNLVVTEKPANAENKEAQKRNLIGSVFHGVRMTRKGFARDYAAIKGLSSESKAGYPVFQEATEIGWIIKATEKTESGEELFWFYTDKLTTTDTPPETESFL
jgi:hypothetical protein